MEIALICLGIYLAIGCATVWCFYPYMTCEVWWGWFVVVGAWPIFWWQARLH